MTSVIPSAEVRIREEWISEIEQIGERFGADVDRVVARLNDEYLRSGIESLLSHLRFCSSIPESYEHDSSAEKLYSKYTDAVLTLAFQHIGMNASLITARADHADVEATSDLLSFVADAKAFRLSRTAKNQKDFKVAAMHRWKHGRPNAVVVCPIYQLPTRTSQIYQDAAALNVAVLSYAHVAAICRLAETTSASDAQTVFSEIFAAVEILNPTKDATAYWRMVNRPLAVASPRARIVWQEEKQATVEAIHIAKTHALAHFSAEREAIQRLSHADAIQRLIEQKNIEGRERMVRSIEANALMDLN